MLHRRLEHSAEPWWADGQLAQYDLLRCLGEPPLLPLVEIASRFPQAGESIYRCRWNVDVDRSRYTSIYPTEGPVALYLSTGWSGR